MTSEGEPDPKKIRSSEPDLKVVIGSEGGEAGTADDAEHEGVVTKWYISPSLAAKSKYIDALLAAPMKESKSRTITFPDISPATWELMMKLIDDPVACRTMKAEDVVCFMSRLSQTRVPRDYEMPSRGSSVSSITNLTLPRLNREGRNGTNPSERSFGKLT